MPYTLKTQQISVKDPDSGEYIGVDVLTEQTTEGLIAELQAEGDTQVARINQAAVDVQSVVDQAEAEAQQLISSTQSSLNTLETQKDTIAQTVASMAELGTDTTLTTAGMAADAKVTGDAIHGLDDAMSNIAEINYEAVDITWTRTDQYINKSGSMATANWYYRFELPVVLGEKFILTGVNDYGKAIYATVDSNGNPVRYPVIGDSGTVSDIEITIENDEAKLILQANANHRANYKLDKYNGYTLNDEIVKTNNLSQDIKDKFPITARVNLLDVHADGVVNGNYISRDGVLHEYQTLNVSDFIPIELNVDYIFPVYANYFGAAQVIYVPFFDINKNYISFVTGTYDETTQLVTAKFTNVNARYTRINISSVNSYLNNSIHHNPEVMMFTQTPYPSEFIPYGDLSYFSDNIYLSKTNMADGNPLFRKTAIFLGDSICNGGSAGDGLDGWAGRIGRKNQMLWKNFGISGATFTSGLSGSSGVISDQPIADPTYSGTPNYIIIEGGTNDADLIGSALNTPPAKFGSFTLGDYTSEFDNTTYCGAIEKLFKNACNNAKQAKVGVIIAQKMGQLNANTSDYTASHNNRRKYFEVLIQLCEKWGIPYLNLWDGSILNPMMPNQYTYQQASSEGKYYTDGQHLTTEGYDYVSPIIENWMRTL